MDEASVKAQNADVLGYGNLQEYLAREVKQYPCLYNMFSKDYKNVRLKERCWQEIGSRLGMDAEVCRAKWRNVRDRYVKEMRKERTGASATSIKPWAMIPKLKFLDVSINKRRSVAEEADAVWDPSVIIAQGDARLSSESLSEGEDATISVITSDQLPTTSQDADVSFLLSLLPQLRKIPDRRKNLLKIEMLQIFHKYEFDYDRLSESP